jgi:nucleoside-diphosphate-sugar epimerase
MRTALIGYTGFVGGNILEQHQFDDLYNSGNIKEIEGKEYDLVVSAANRAEMWRINQEPEVDRAEIDDFISHLGKATIKKLVLISTVGVYKDPNGANEDTPIDTNELLPYGLNRYYLEKYCQDKFDTTVLRLPGLFGKGLKKNVIYDLLNDNNVDRIHAEGVYQYYNLANIWKDISVALENNLPLVNLATPPVATSEVAKTAFGITFSNRPEGVSPAHWDMHSKYSKLYGGPENYLYTKEEELAEIKLFVEKSRKNEAGDL